MIEKTGKRRQEKSNTSALVGYLLCLGVIMVLYLWLIWEAFK